VTKRVLPSSPNPPWRGKLKKKKKQEEENKSQSHIPSPAPPQRPKI